MTVAAIIAAALRRQGMRLASADERGWYVVVLVDDVPRRVWATDAPEAP